MTTTTTPPSSTETETETTATTSASTTRTAAAAPTSGVGGPRPAAGRHPTGSSPPPAPTPGPHRHSAPSPQLVVAIRRGASSADATGSLVGTHDQMLAEGLLHLLVPEELGGAGAAPAEWFDTACAVAHADPSAGWVMAQGAVQSAWIAVAGSDELVDAFFARPQTLASTSAGNVAADRRDGHLVVRDGRWGYASGSTGAAFLGGMVRTTAPDGSPATYMAVVPAEQATIEPTWDTLGLRGTASHHIAFGPRAAIPASHTFSWPGLTIVRPSAIASALENTVWAVTVSAAAVNLGAASRSIEEALAAAEHKRHRFDTVPVLQQPGFVRGIASLRGSVELARAGVRGMLDRLWAEARAGRGPDGPSRARLRLAAISAARVGAEVVREAQALVGADALHRGHCLERLVRDSQMLLHHVATSPSTAEQLGGVLLGTYDGPPGFI